MKLAYILKKYRSPLLTLLFFSLFIYYLLDHSNDFKNIFSLNPYLILFLVSGHIFAFLTNAFFTKTAIVHLNRNISLLKSLFATILGAIGNFFMPVGSGTGIKAVYLKHHVNLPYSGFISVLSANYIFIFVVNSIIGLTTLLFLRNTLEQEILFGLAGIFCTIIVVSLLFLSAKASNIIKKAVSKRRKVRIVKIILRVAEGWQVIRGDKKIIKKLLLFCFLNFIAVYIVTWSSFAAFNVSLNVASMALLASLGSLSIIFNITPGSIGFREAIFYAAAPSVGLTAIIGAGLLDRTIRLLLIFVFWAAIKIKEKNTEQEFYREPSN